MKNTLIIALLALVTLAGQAQIKCHIEGELRDTTQGRTVIVCPVTVDTRCSDNYVTMKADDNGHFACDVETDKMCLYSVYIEEQEQQGFWITEEFLVEDNATVKLLFDGWWRVVSGGPEQMQKVRMDDEAEPLFRSKIKEIMKRQRGRMIAALEGKEKSQEEDSLEQQDLKEHRKLSDSYGIWQSEYLKKHPMLFTLYEKAYRMFMNCRDDEWMEKELKSYHATYENFRPQDPVHSVIRSYEAIWKLKPGKPYADYQVRNTDGKLVPISSLMKDKVVLVDLWASWCGPCRRHSIAMIPIYEKYKDKGFTVLAIAAERRAEDIQKAIEQDGYPWSSLLELNQENHVWEKNGIGSSGGAMFLIDRDGTILSTSTDAEELEPLIKKALNIEQ